MSTILLADDNFGDTEALRLLLEFEGYRVVTTANGYAALRAAQRERPDLVITDWEMPLMDGIELCRQLKRCAELSGIPVMMISAAVPPGEGVPLWAAFFRKPAPLRRLIEWVRHLETLSHAKATAGTYSEP
jgi:CheY-like chemotaxis protein